MIRKSIPESSIIYLLTQEKDFDIFKRPEVQKIVEELKSRNIIIVPEKYFRLGWKKMVSLPVNLLKMAFFIIRKKVNVIHSEGMGAGMTGTLLKTFTGKKHVVDSYEPLAYSMVESDIWPESSFAFRMMKYFEKRQAVNGDVIIGSVDSMPEYAKEKYNISLKNFYCKPSVVDVQKFNYYEEFRNKFRVDFNLEGKIVGLYAGKFGGQYLEREIFDFFKVCADYWGDQFRIVLLTAHTDEEVSNYCKITGVDVSIVTRMFVPFPEMHKYLSIGDFGITPVKPVESKRYCSPIKDGEYWATGLPVVITDNISDDSDIIRKENIGTVITEYSKEGYLKNVKEIEALLQEPRQVLRDRVRNAAIKYRHFDIAEKVYTDAYTRLFVDY